jgi:tripartite-type tricarboxylate transporter receptor subunit TctC
MKNHPLLRAFGVALASVLALGTARAEVFPSRTIKLVVPGPPGGGTDTLGRMVADGLSKQLGQAVVVDNRAGASGMIGASEAARAPADGYTLFMAYSGTLTTNQWLYKKMSYDPAKDFAPVSAFAQVPNILVVNATVPATNVKELIALAKAQPGKLNYASSYIGSMSHLSMELLKQMTGTDILHVPYNGDAPSMQALLSGQVQMMVTNTVSCLPMVKSGKLRALGVATSVRTAVLPDLPTIAEAGVPGFDTTLWYGVMVPAATPPSIVAKLNDAIRATQSSPDLKARLASTGSEPLVTTPIEFGELIRRDAERVGKVVQGAGIKPE